MQPGSAFPSGVATEEHRRFAPGIEPLERRARACRGPSVARRSRGPSEDPFAPALRAETSKRQERRVATYPGRFRARAGGFRRHSVRVAIQHSPLPRSAKAASPMADYIFGENHEDRELTRLRRIESALDAGSRELIEKTGIASGWTCLEVGAGGGSILRYLGERVGPQGHAVGVDKNASFLKGFPTPPFEIFEGDVLDVYRAHAFDLIHVRYVLIHNRAATDILIHLRTLLKPGGWLVLEEPDFESAEWLDDTYRSAGERVNRAICKMFSGMSLDPGYGKRAVPMLSDVGFSVSHIEYVGHLEAGRGPVAMVMADSTNALQDKYVATGEATGDDVDRYIRGAQDPDSFANYYSTVRVLARRPR